jgi:hypothetical protein
MSVSQLANTEIATIENFENDNYENHEIIFDTYDSEPDLFCGYAYNSHSHYDTGYEITEPETQEEYEEIMAESIARSYKYYFGFNVKPIYEEPFTQKSVDMIAEYEDESFKYIDCNSTTYELAELLESLNFTKSNIDLLVTLNNFFDNSCSGCGDYSNIRAEYSEHIKKARSSTSIASDDCEIAKLARNNIKIYRFFNISLLYHPILNETYLMRQGYEFFHEAGLFFTPKNIDNFIKLENATFNNFINFLEEFASNNIYTDYCNCVLIKNAYK